MQYNYHETDAHGALDAFLERRRGKKLDVEARTFHGAWIPATPDDLTRYSDFRIREEPKRETVEEAIRRMAKFANTPFDLSCETLIELWQSFAAALKAEILEEVKK